MSLWSRMFSRRSRVTPMGTPASPARELETLFGTAPTGSGVSVTPDSVMAASAVLACVRVLSESVASLPCHLYRRLDVGKDTASNHPLYPVLHRLANPEMSAFDFFEMQQAHILLRGNAYAYIERDRGARPKGLWPLRPDQVRVERRTDGWIWYVWSPPQAQALEFRRDEILHVHGLSRDGLIGLSPILLAAEVFGLSIAQTGFAASFFGNGTVMGGTLEHPATLSEPAAKRLVESVRGAHEGFSRAHKLLVLEEGMKYAAIGIEPEAAQFLESRKFQVEEIARIYRVPLHLIQSLDRATFSNIEHQGLDFVIHSLRPWLVRWEQAISRDVLLPSERETYFAEFMVDALLRGDIKTRYEAYSVAINWGWMSPDDVREKENLNPRPDGKGGVYLTPTNMTTMQQILTAPAPGTPPTTPDATPEPDPAPEDMPPASKRAAPALDALQDVLADAFGRVMRRELADCEKPVRKLEETRDGEAFDAWKARFASDHADFTSKTIAPALRAVEKMADLAPGTLENWGEKWQSETLDGLTEARNGDHPAEKWAEKVDEWRSNRAVSWAEIVLEQAEMARKEAA
jgi:HK97 family phage portal protein